MLCRSLLKETYISCDNAKYIVPIFLAGFPKYVTSMQKYRIFMTRVIIFNINIIK